MADHLCLTCKFRQADNLAYQGNGYPHLVCQQAGVEPMRGRKFHHYVMHPGDKRDALVGCSLYEKAE